MGRNEKCSCGSEKKFKHCCGKDTKIPWVEGSGQLLGMTLAELANPNCLACGGKGYKDVRIVGYGDEALGVPRYCSCLKKKYFEEKMRLKAEEDLKKESEEVDDNTDKE